MDATPQHAPPPAAPALAAASPAPTPAPAPAPTHAALSAARVPLLPPIPEARPLLPAVSPPALVSPPSIVSPSSLVSTPGAKQNGRALHVQFDAQPPLAAPGSSGSSSSSSSSSDDEEASLAEARPPDGGWGWVVVFASFMVNLIADGITFSFGVLFPCFTEYFGEGKGKTAWIASIFMAVPLLSGPVASFLTDRYGCRVVTVVGALLAALGFVISAFVDNMETLFLTFGLMAGFGLSLCYVAAVVIVAYYFDKKRSLATGISVCGSGIGTFVFAPLTDLLLEAYGWRGTTLILAGLLLNMVVCGLLFRDLPWTATMNEERARERKRKRELKRLKRFRTPRAAALPPASAAPPPPAPPFSSLVDLPTYMRGGVAPDVFELMSQRGRAYAVLAAASPGAGLLGSRSFSDGGRLADCGSAPSPPPPARRPHPHPHPPPPAFLQDLRVHRRSLTYRGAMLNISRYRLRASSCPNIFRNSMTTIAKEKVQWYAGLWDFGDLVVEMLDFSHFHNPAFVVFSLSNFLLYMWYDVPYVYLTDHAMDRGFTKSQGSMLIAIIGIFNMFGELVMGWAGDLRSVDALTLYSLGLSLCGVSALLLPLLTSFPALAAAAGAFGALIAANYSLTSIILVNQISLENFTNAYGLLLLIQGLANLVGTPLGGWLYDLTGSYDLSFYLTGIFIVLSGLLLMIPDARRSAPTPQTTQTAKTANTTQIAEHKTSNGKLPV